MYENLIKRATIVIEALPYIRQFQGRTFVIKYGGSAMRDEKLKKRVAQDIVLLKYVGINPVVVHGGGDEINFWLNKIGKKPSFVKGLRVTDEETMEVVEMVLTGKINKGIVSLINQAGGSAVGLSGKDGNLILAKKKKTKINYGFVGEVISVKTDLINSTAQDGFVPVISSIGTDARGQSYNINADHVAGSIAGSLKAEKLIILTDVAGILKKNKLISRLNLEEAKKVLQSKVVSGGMIPKVESCLTALKKGVKCCHVIDGRIPHAILLEIFTHYGIGTMIKK